MSRNSLSSQEPQNVHHRGDHGTCVSFRALPSERLSCWSGGGGKKIWLLKKNKLQLQFVCDNRVVCEKVQFSELACGPTKKSGELSRCFLHRNTRVYIAEMFYALSILMIYKGENLNPAS